MKQGKPKLTRQDAERLFAGLPGENTSRPSSRPANPFGGGNPFDAARPAEKELKLWKDNLVTLPIAVVLPACYASLSQLREAMVRAWGVKWVRETSREVVTEFPEGWKAVRPATGPIELRDPSNVVRAVYGWAEDAELRLLPRYLVETQSNSSTGMGSLLVRDRANGQILERASNWSSLTGTNHPDWARLSGWINSHYPQHQDPLRYWEDCELNISKAGV